MTEVNALPFTAAGFRQLLKDKKLMATRCVTCGTAYLPPRAICPKCHGEEMTWSELSGRGTLAAFTSVFIGPTFMNKLGYSRANPYVSGIVELEEGIKISARILGLDAAHPGQIQIGTPVAVEFLEEGEAKLAVLAFRAG
jgi:uncharacterized protein